MKSITIHGVDDHLAGLLKQEAERSGSSMTRTVKRLLEEAMGLKPHPAGHNREHFESFLGIWSKQDEVDFKTACADFERIDDRDWK